MPEYTSKNSGLLAMADVKEGDKIVLIAPAYEQFSEKNQKSYWNCKVKLPNGTEKLAGLMDVTCDACAAKWGAKTEDWVGHSVTVKIKTSKAGNNYIFLIPTDDAAEVSTAPKSADSEEINPADIPF